MSLSIAIALIMFSSCISYWIGKFKGVDQYHEHLLRTGKIQYKDGTLDK